MPAGAPVLEIRNLSKTFPGVRALLDASVTIAAGEIHSLVGQNGSGKSTLIKVLAGVYEPDAGATASVRGEALALGDGKAAHDLGIRFVHQDLGLIDNLTAVDNIALGFGYDTAAGGRIRWRAQRERAALALSLVVDDFPLDRPAGTLTVFQRTALAIARALQDFGENGSLLVLDEPTATMPRDQVEHLFTLLRRIRERGTPVLLVTHHMEEVFAVSDRVTVLRDGSIVSVEQTADLDTPRLVSLMTGGVHRKLERGAGPDLEQVALSVRGLTGDTLKGLDLDVHRGEIVGVAGLGGSGREEICALLFGAEKRTGGEIAVDGKTLPPNDPGEAVTRRIGMVPAHRHTQGLILSESVRRNMTLATLTDFVKGGRVQRKREAAAVAEHITAFGVKTASAEVPVNTLSGGNQQKVVLAKWLRLKPTVLLLDEPTQGVDIAAQADLHQLIFEAAAAGTAVLVCSSDEMELARISDRVLVVRDGTVHAELDSGRATPHNIFAATLGTAPDDGAAGHLDEDLGSDDRTAASPTLSSSPVSSSDPVDGE
ncbi:sugar ABC transporter ATP-binding protein [Pseudonocardia kujensis]|uniref:sugar ABC transporter ATP-binding protein n=1 Tax=Pseudonocardia kujensis TaxID=1128675 RepID=UPI001E5CD8D3|nr:sugar ABC transporter ATP-binding protein [Pseudonocardia kujensis]MCE0763513.1 sugar ABC transporter ATP-binding protein [Pseudonocardia kujensis]